MAIMHECSDGSRVSQVTIDNRYAKSRANKYCDSPVSLRCQAGCGQTGNSNDHTIAQARCKHIHKTELIWNPNNYVWNCNNCHKQWENFKSGEWVHHANVEERLAFMKEHDPEGYRMRVELTEKALTEQADKNEFVNKYF